MQMDPPYEDTHKNKFNIKINIWSTPDINPIKINNITLYHSQNIKKDIIWNLGKDASTGNNLLVDGNQGDHTYMLCA
jgi:hypothetical protein